eukprot:jgi/Chlat1/4276/Chrsp29S08886
MRLQLVATVVAVVEPSGLCLAFSPTSLHNGPSLAALLAAAAGASPFAPCAAPRSVHAVRKAPPSPTPPPAALASAWLLCLFSSVCASLSIGGPYRAPLCGTELKASASVDACGRERLLEWDLNNDGVYGDAHGDVYCIIPADFQVNGSGCPNSPCEVASTTIYVTTPRLGINLASAAYPCTGKEATRWLALRRRRMRRHTVNTAGPGQKTITATIRQFGAVASFSRNITVEPFYLGGPYRISPCNYVRLVALVTVNACGRVEGVLTWDVDDNGALYDYTGSPSLNTRVVPLTTGVHPIRVQSSSNPTYRTPPTEVHTLNVTVTLAIMNLITISTSLATTGEDFFVDVVLMYVSCLPYTLPIDCGADAVTSQYETSSCRYNTLEERIATAILTQNGVSVSSSHNITIRTLLLQHCFPYERSDTSVS